MYLITSSFDGSVVYRSPSFEEIQAVYSPAVHRLFAISPGCEVYTFGDGAWSVHRSTLTPAPIFTSSQEGS